MSAVITVGGAPVVPGVVVVVSLLVWPADEVDAAGSAPHADARSNAASHGRIIDPRVIVPSLFRQLHGVHTHLLLFLIHNHFPF